MATDRPSRRPFRIVPRALREDDAADYVALSVATFRLYVVPVFPAVQLTPGRVGWLREDLDAWLDQKAGRSPPEVLNSWDQPDRRLQRPNSWD